MQQTKRSTALTMSVLALGAAACNFSVDGSLIKPNNSTPDPDLPIEDGGTDMPPELHDGGPEPDGSVPGFPDGSAPAVDASLITPRPCSSDLDCPAEDYCSVGEGGCAPRCSELGCAGPFIPHTVFHTSSEAVWANGSTLDALGNSEKNGSIVAWDLTNEARTVAESLTGPEILEVVDGHVFYNDDGKLQRVPVAGGQPTVMADRATSLWAAGSSIFWSLKTAAGAELWKAPRDGFAPAEKVAEAAHDGWLTGNAQAVFRFVQSPEVTYTLGKLWMEKLPDLSEETLIRDDWFNANDSVKPRADERFFYYSGEAQIQAIDLSDPTVVKNASPAGALANYELRGSFVYWGYAPFDDQVYFGRSTPEGAALTEFVATPQAADYILTPHFTVVGSTLVYTHQVERRLFTLEIPLQPCEAELACPAELVCGSDKLCH